jgi:hypothetical protein
VEFLSETWFYSCDHSSTVTFEPGSKLSRPERRSSKTADDWRLLKEILDGGSAYEKHYEWDDPEVDPQSLLRQRRYEEDYRHVKLGFCGSGETEFSKIFTKLVEERVDAFCLHEHLNWEVLLKLHKTFYFLSQYAIRYDDSQMFTVICDVAEAEHNPDKAIRLCKESVFWYGFFMIRFAQFQAVEGFDPDDYTWSLMHPRRYL